MMTRHRRFTAIAVLTLLTASATGLRAEIQVGAGCLIHSMPFYHKLMNAGVFDAPLVFSNQPQPLPLLFRMARSFRYRSDKAQNDLWQTPEETSQLFSGDCEDKAIWLYTLMRQNGYRDVSLHIGRYALSSKRFHMWVTYVDEAGTTMLLDPTIQRKPWPVSAFAEKNYRSLHILTGNDCVSL